MGDWNSPHWRLLQSPCGAIFLRRGLNGHPPPPLGGELQSPCGAIFLRQYTPLSAVLYSTAIGGFYENHQLSTGCLWITTRKVLLFAMNVYKVVLLDFL